MRWSAPPPTTLHALCLAGIPQTQGKQDTDSRHLFITQPNKCKASLTERKIKIREEKKRRRMGERNDKSAGLEWHDRGYSEKTCTYSYIYTHTRTSKAKSDLEKERRSSGFNVVSYHISPQSMASLMPRIFQWMKEDECSASRLRIKPLCVYPPST